MERTDTLAIVSGAAGSIGKAFLAAFAAQGLSCVGISRRPIESLYPIVITDLANADQTIVSIRGLDLEHYERVVFVHTVGCFRFENDGIPLRDCDGDGIDDEVFASNVNTWDSVINALSLFEGQLTLCNIGSISDKHKIPWWGSYSRSKNLVREKMCSLAGEGSVRAVSLSVSTVKTDNECDLRPYADKRYWLEPEELVERAIPYLLFGASGYLDVDIFNPMPDFDPFCYHLDAAAIRRRWMNEMGK